MNEKTKHRLYVFWLESGYYKSNEADYTLDDRNHYYYCSLLLFRMFLDKFSTTVCVLHFKAVDVEACANFNCLSSVPVGYNLQQCIIFQKLMVYTQNRKGSIRGLVTVQSVHKEYLYQVYQVLRHIYCHLHWQSENRKKQV